MVKPNYAYEKRQRELEKKRRKEEKAQKKSSDTGATSPDGGDAAVPESVAPESNAASPG